MFTRRTATRGGLSCGLCALLGLVLTAALGSSSGSASAALPQATAAGDWPQFQGGPSHTGFDAGEKSLTKTNVSQLGTAWHASLEGQSSYSTVAVTGGVVYAASGARVAAFDEATGASLWQVFPVQDGVVIGTPAVRGGLVVVAYDQFPERGTKEKYFVTALNSATGATVWTKPVSRVNNVSVTTTANRVYLSLASGQVEALGLSHGYKIWLSPVLPNCSGNLSSPSLSGHLVVVGDSGLGVSALRVTDGTVAWQDTPASGCGAGPENWLPAVTGGTVYAGLIDRVVALDAATGTVRWANNTVTSVFGPLSVTAHTVVAAQSSGARVVALSRDDGSVAWRTAKLAGFVSGVTTFGGLVWAAYQVSSGPPQAIALTSGTGRQVFTSSLPYPAIQGTPPPVVDQGQVFLHAANDLVALGLPG